MAGMTNNKRILPIGIQSFPDLIADHYVYIDKTDYIYKLVHSSKQFFLSRPRRFGKSLLLSTLRAYWEGRKELFEGLKISTLEANNPDAWKSYPVFYFDFNRDNYLRDRALEDVLEAHLTEWEQLYGREHETTSLAIRFQNLLKRAYEQTGNRCVVLVDEYDKPLLESSSDSEILEQNKAAFKGFFTSLKSFDSCLQFVFVTGVTKFSKVSIFSDMNQLKDISLNYEYAAICGITEAELLANLGVEVKELADFNGISSEECFQKLRDIYDGYRFHPRGQYVYNPFSLLNALDEKEFRSYWYSTGTPSFLIKRLRNMDFDPRRFSDGSLLADEKVLTDYNDENPDPLPLLYQSGYLTIANYDRSNGIYTLSFPNQEVKYGFLDSLMPEYIPAYHTGSGTDIMSLNRYIENGDLEKIRDVLTALFASIPYTESRDPFENYFQAVIYLVFTLLNKYVKSEVHSFKGRADCIVETRKFVYLFEFKRDSTSDEALAQIEEMGYALPYQADARKVFRIGIKFDSETRMISEWKVL